MVEKYESARKSYGDRSAKKKEISAHEKNITLIDYTLEKASALGEKKVKTQKIKYLTTDEKTVTSHQKFLDETNKNIEKELKKQDVILEDQKKTAGALKGKKSKDAITSQETKIEHIHLT